MQSSEIRNTVATICVCRVQRKDFFALLNNLLLVQENKICHPKIYLPGMITILLKKKKDQGRTVNFLPNSLKKYKIGGQFLEELSPQINSNMKQVWQTSTQQDLFDQNPLCVPSSLDDLASLWLLDIKSFHLPVNFLTALCSPRS